MRITIPVVLLLSALLTVGNLRGAEVKTEPGTMSADELLLILNAHFFKWSYQSAASYHKLNFRFVYCARTPSGDFQRKVLYDNPYLFKESRQQNDIIVYLANKGANEPIELGFGIYAGSLARLNVPSDFARTGYVTIGPNSGGLPLVIGSEYILLFRNKDKNTSFDKTDMRDYVSVEIETE